MTAQQSSENYQLTANEPIVPWRETFQERFEVKVSVKGKNDDATYKIDESHFESNIEQLIHRINRQQGEIKSVMSYDYSLAKGFNTGVSVTSNNQGGWGFGYGVSYPDFVCVIYEITEYIPYSEYKKRIARAHNKAQAERIQSQIDTLTSQRSEAAAELATVEQDLKTDRSEHERLNQDEPVESSGWRGKGWSFNDKFYKSYDKAIAFKNDLLKDLSTRITNNQHKESTLNSNIEKIDQQLQQLRSELDAINAED